VIPHGRAHSDFRGWAASPAYGTYKQRARGVNGVLALGHWDSRSFWPGLLFDRARNRRDADEPLFQRESETSLAERKAAAKLPSAEKVQRRWPLAKQTLAQSSKNCRSGRDVAAVSTKFETASGGDENYLAGDAFVLRRTALTRPISFQRSRSDRADGFITRQSVLCRKSGAATL